MAIIVGPLEPLLQDSTVTEILINGLENIYVDRDGQGLVETEIKFSSMDELMLMINSIVLSTGRRLDESYPIVDIRLQDGTRVNIVIPPIATGGPFVTLAKGKIVPLSWDQLLGFETLTQDMVVFLESCVKGRLNILISGGVGAGKTTILNALSEFIPDEDRVISVDNFSIVKLRNRHVAHMETRPANMEGKGEISLRDLIINAAKMRPDRIISGEVSGGEVVPLLQAYNTGIDGGMFSVHANSPRDAISRLEVFSMAAGADIPMLSLREQIASAVDLVIQISRLRDGSRRILNITEVQGMENAFIKMVDIFDYEQTGFENDRILGRHRLTGAVPRFSDLIGLSADFFKR